jgi:hypothetical protein
MELEDTICKIFRCTPKPIHKEFWTIMFFNIDESVKLWALTRNVINYENKVRLDEIFAI